MHYVFMNLGTIRLRSVQDSDKHSKIHKKKVTVKTLKKEMVRAMRMGMGVGVG